MACVITLTCVATAFVPQMTTQSLLAISRGSGPAMRPVPARNPGQARLTQMVPLWREYFFECASRLTPSRITLPMVPA